MNYLKHFYKAPIPFSKNVAKFKFIFPNILKISELPFKE